MANAGQLANCIQFSYDLGEDLFFCFRSGQVGQKGEKRNRNAANLRENKLGTIISRHTGTQFNLNLSTPTRTLLFSTCSLLSCFFIQCLPVNVSFIIGRLFASS